MTYPFLMINVYEHFIYYHKIFAVNIVQACEYAAAICGISNNNLNRMLYSIHDDRVENFYIPDPDSPNDPDEGDYYTIVPIDKIQEIDIPK